MARMALVALAVTVATVTVVVLGPSRLAATDSTTDALDRFREEPKAVAPQPLREEFEGDVEPPAMYGSTRSAVIIGEERCAAFRASTSPRRRAAAAGLFNTGTNLFWQLLSANCRMPMECPGRGESVLFQVGRPRSGCAPFLAQVPWGKHNPLHWRGSHFAGMHEHVNISEVLPVAIVKEPLFWMKSMCRMEYAARFRHGQAQCCPSPLDDTRAEVRWRKERRAYSYDSLVKLWSVWNAEYLDFELPRLVVRYEDLLWRTRETVARVCACVGGTPSRGADFNLVSASAKSGVAHANADTGRDSAVAKYANESKRYEFLTDADIDLFHAHADPRLLDALGYTVSADRRRTLFPPSQTCRPDRGEYLRSMGLKQSDHGPVPLDDESDGVVARGVFYANPKRPGASFQAYQRKHGKKAAKT